MGKPTLLLQWVIVMAVSRLHAVPVRSRGGVIYGTEFLKILDPRSQLSVTENEAESQSSTPSLLNETTLSTTAAFESSTQPTISSTFSFSVQPSTLSATRQKSRALNTLPLVSSSNDLKGILKFGIKTPIGDTSTIHRTKSQPSAVPNKENIITVNNTTPTLLSQDKNDTELFLDYDYYYYYLDDLHLPPLEQKNSSVKEAETLVKEAETIPSSSSISPLNIRRNINSVTVSTTPTTLVQVTATESQKTRQTTTKPLEPTVSTTSKPVHARTIGTTKTPITNVPPSSRSSTKMATIRATTKSTAGRSPFRYQVETTSESITASSTAESVADKHSFQNIVRLFNKTETPTKTERETDSLKSRRLETTTETTSSGRARSDTRKLAAALRNLAATSPPQRATSQQSPVEDVMSAITTKSTPTSTFEPQALLINKRQQRPIGSRNSTNRNFRYTTPLPKDEETSGDLNANKHTLEKSLGSATSSSIVVEVRVESPRPEARRMPSRESLGTQTLSRNLQKSTPSPVKTVHTVDPEYLTTSFLLSDSLVVDLSSEPRTSDKQTEDIPQSRQQSSINSHTTEKPETPVPLQLEQQKSENNNISSAISSRRGTSRAINAKPAASQILATEIELSKSNSRTNPESNVSTNANENDSTNLKFENNSKPTQTQRHSISRSVLRTVANTEAKVSRANDAKSIISTTSEKPLLSTTKISNITLVSNQTLSTNTTTPFQKRPRVSSLHGSAPLGLSPFGEAPGGLSPFGDAPEGVHPYGLQPTGLHPHGLSPHGGPTNTSANATNAAQNTITFVDATVAEGANSSVGYLAVEHNISRFRLEEKTPDGFIIGEYGEVDHRTGDVNGVRYTADSTADPNLIYDALIKFLNL